MSLIAGCHADEPTGPETLTRLVAWLGSLADGAAPLAAASWWLVPHVNPDGAAANAAWGGVFRETTDSRGEPDRGFDLAAHVRGAVREAPGDDVEFGFPRSPGDREARPENRAVAGFLTGGAPFHLHATLHGMAFAPGPWFLLEPAWAARTAALRREVGRRVEALGYELLDWDREGDKGFRQIERGFSTRPDSAAMRAHFEARGDLDTAARFRPSSMEHVRALGGDPLTLVSEMPLFLVPAEPEFPFALAGPGREAFRAWLAALVAERGAEGAVAEAGRRGLRPMPLRDQMRLQLAFLEQGLAAVEAGLDLG